MDGGCISVFYENTVSHQAEDLTYKTQRTHTQMSVTGCWQNLLFFSPSVSPNTCVTLTFTFSPISSSQIAPDCYQLCSLSNAPLLAPPPRPPSIMFALTLSLSPSVPLSPFFLLYCSPSLFFFFLLQLSFSKDLSEAVEQKTARGNNFRILSPPPFPLLPVSQTHECAVHLHFRYQAVVLVSEWAGIRIHIVSGIEFMTNLLFVLRHMRRVFFFFPSLGRTFTFR